MRAKPNRKSQSNRNLKSVPMKKLTKERKKSPFLEMDERKRQKRRKKHKHKTAAVATKDTVCLIDCINLTQRIAKWYLIKRKRRKEEKKNNNVAQATKQKQKQKPWRENNQIENGTSSWVWLLYGISFRFVEDDEYVEYIAWNESEKYKWSTTICKSMAIAPNFGHNLCVRCVCVCVLRIALRANMLIFGLICH